MQSTPITIANWIIAYNLAMTNQEIPSVNLSNILNAKDTDLIPLAKSLTLDTMDSFSKERIISILIILDKLINDMSLYDRLPEDIILLLLEYFDCQSIILSCKFSQRFNEACQSGKTFSILRRKLRSATGFDTSNYDLDRLMKLCHYSHYNEKKYIFAGPENSFVIIDGYPYVFGDLTYGLEEWTNKESPTKLPGLSNISQISSSEHHTLYLTNDGQVYVSGYNDYGQLGIGDNQWDGDPILISGLNNIVSVSAGYHHSLVLDNHGYVYAFGSNASGQLGLGDYHDRDIPVLIPNLNNVIQIVADDGVSAVLNNQGQVYGFGFSFQRLGVQYNSPIPILIFGLNNIIQLAMKRRRLLALSNDGKVYTCMSDSDNISVVYGLDNIVQISIGAMFLVALTEDRYLYVLSRRYDDGYIAPISIPESAEIVQYQSDYYTVPILVPELFNVVQIATGNYHVLTLTSTGDIYAFGQNGEGQLGLDDFQDRLVPTLIPNLKITL